MEYFTEETMFKVYDSLRAAGLTEEKTRETITDMQNKGILFREKQPERPGSVLRSESS